MRPFISAARIVLLVLIDIYCEGEVLEADDDFVLQLITSYMMDTYARPSNRRQRHLARWQRAHVNVDLLLDGKSLKPALQGCFVARHGAASPSQVPELPLCVTLWDELVTRLWMHLRCLDSLAAFFEHIGRHIAPTYTMLRTRREAGLPDPPERVMLLDRRSPVGLLVYQAAIEFERLDFSGRCALWEEFVQYRAPLRDDFKMMWPDEYAAVIRTMDETTSWFPSSNSSRSPGMDALRHILHGIEQPGLSVSASTDETEKLVALLIDRESTGHRPQRPLREPVDRIIQGSTLVPASTAYYRMLEAGSIGDMNTAFDQLHRYYDLVARQGSGPGIGYNVGPMQRAILQRDFGEHPNDLRSMLASVQAGRESRDYPSLRLSLMWMYMYARTLPQHIRPLQLQGLAGRPTDGDQVLPYVRHEALLSHSEAHFAQSCLLEAHVSLSDGHLPRYAKNLIQDGSHRIVAAHITGLEGQLMSVSMQLWDSLGHGLLGRSHARAFMSTRQDSVRVDEAVRVASRLAQQHAQSGDFGQARAVLMAACPPGLASLKHQSQVRHALTYVAAVQAVRAREFDEADELLLRRLPQGGFPSTAPEQPTQGPWEVDSGIATGAALLHVESLVRRGDATLVAARNRLDAFEATYDSEVGDLQTMLRIELARADIYARAGRGMRAVTSMIHTIMTCLRQHYHGVLWEAAGELARLLAAEGEFQAARTLLAIVIPRMLETPNTEVTARLYQQLGDVCMGMAGETWKGTRQNLKLDPGYNQNQQRQARVDHFLSGAWRSFVQAKAQFRRAGSANVVIEGIDKRLAAMASTAQRLQHD